METAKNGAHIHSYWIILLLMTFCTFVLAEEKQQSLAEIGQKKDEYASGMWRNGIITGVSISTMIGTYIAGSMIGDSAEKRLSEYNNLLISGNSAVSGDEIHAQFVLADTLFYSSEIALLCTAVFGVWFAFDTFFYFSYDTIEKKKKDVYLIPNFRLSSDNVFAGMTIRY